MNNTFITDTRLQPRPEMGSAFYGVDTNGNDRRELCRCGRPVVFCYSILRVCARCWNHVNFEELKA